MAGETPFRGVECIIIRAFGRKISRWLRYSLMRNLSTARTAESRSKGAQLLLRQCVPLSPGVIGAVPLLRQPFLRVAKWLCYWRLHECAHYFALSRSASPPRNTSHVVPSARHPLFHTSTAPSSHAFLLAPSVASSLRLQWGRRQGTLHNPMSRHLRAALWNVLLEWRESWQCRQSSRTQTCRQASQQ